MLVLDPQTGLIEQFEGFFGLEDTNLADYEWRTQSMQAILGIEGANQAGAETARCIDAPVLQRLLCRHCKRTDYTPRTDLRLLAGSSYPSYPGLPLRQDRRGG